jgi:metallo-beta-lactamase family protein
MIMKLKFLGANRQVTGSCTLLETGGIRLLIDCGLFQERAFLERNWASFPLPQDQIDYLLLTHIHLDHSGLLPKLVCEGFSRPILTTSASKDMIPIMLLDSAHIQEEDAAFKRKRHKKEGRKGPYPEIPLYTVQDAQQVFPLLEEVPYSKPKELGPNIQVAFHDAGHILGSAMIEIKIQDDGKAKRLVFSGDIGQWNKPIIRDPSVFDQADYVIMESTYGDRIHKDPGGVADCLRQIIDDTAKAGGNVVVPTFAVERAQELLFYLSQMVREKRIPQVFIFLDSPMALDITEVFKQHPECMDEETKRLFEEGKEPFRFPGLKLVRTVEESKAINSVKAPCVILAGSGMCTGGRIKHHLVHNISRPQSTILFVGYQAEGTLGRQIVEGNPQVRIHGQYHPVRARVEQIDGFSAHADRRGLLRWLSCLQRAPQKIFLIHGEKKAAENLASQVRRDEGWPVRIPDYLEECRLE